MSNSNSATKKTKPYIQTDTNGIIAISPSYDEFMEELEWIKKLKHENVVLVLGATGPTKTALASFLTEGKLSAREIAFDVYWYTTNEKLNLTYLSIKSLDLKLPNVFHDEVNTVYIDLPGTDKIMTFRDFTSLADIRKDLFPQAKSVKLLFVFENWMYGGYFFVEDLKRSLIEAVKLVNDVDHYVDAIGMVVTKIDNEYFERSGEIEIVSDRSVIYSIPDSLEIFQKVLKLTKLKSKEERNFSEKIIELINILSKHDNSTSIKIYDKVGILPKPEKFVNMQDTKLLEEEIKHIRHIVDENLKYVSLKVTPSSIHSNPTFNIGHKTQHRDNKTHSSLYEFLQRIRNFRELKHKKVILVLGNDGSGKTALSSFLTRGNLSTEAFRKVLVNKDNLTHHSFKSRDLRLPNVFFDEKHNTVYLDLPGMDKRMLLSYVPSLKDIQNDFLPHAKSVKLLIVSEHCRYTLRGSLEKLDESLNVAAKLAVDVEQYNDAIAMVFNKIRPLNTKKNKESKVIGDENAIRQVTGCLSLLKENLNEDLKHSRSKEAKMFIDRKIKLINILLKHKNSNSRNIYEKIGILRDPFKAINTNNTKIFVKEKEHIQHIVYDNFKYVPIE